jgi:hypothetical protein
MHSRGNDEEPQLDHPKAAGRTVIQTGNAGVSTTSGSRDPNRAAAGALDYGASW